MHCNIQMFSRRMWRFQRPCRQERRPTCCTPSPAAGEPTHVAGHTLDLVITTADIVIADLCVGGIISDHALLYFKLCMKKKIETVHTVSHRAWQRLDHKAFASDLAASTLCCNLSSLSCVLSADDLVDMYNRVMTELLDRHCPSVTVQCRQRPSTPWFNAECRAAGVAREYSKDVFDAPALTMIGVSGLMNSRECGCCTRTRTLALVG